MGAAGVEPVTDRQFNMDAAVVRLLALAANKRSARSRPDGADDEARTPYQIFSISDFPEPSAEWTAAHEALRSFADELVEIGGADLMVDVYDEAAERHGYRAIGGVSASWDGRHGWWH